MRPGRWRTDVQARAFEPCKAMKAISGLETA